MPFPTNAEIKRMRLYAEKEQAKEAARCKALERASFRCPVLKEIEKTLKGDFLDVQEALEVIDVELQRMPEAAATRSVIRQLLKVGEA